jgi:NADH:ubiquinone oxidoreductase subunit F (NADH-binding)
VLRDPARRNPDRLRAVSRHESPEIGAMVGRMLNALIRRAAEGDQEALEALAEVECLAPQATNAGLALAREHYSLAELGRVLGTSRQAVIQRTDRAHNTAHRFAPSCRHLGCVGVKRCREGGAK